MIRYREWFVVCRIWRVGGEENMSTQCSVESLERYSGDSPSVVGWLVRWYGLPPAMVMGADLNIVDYKLSKRSFA